MKGKRSLGSDPFIERIKDHADEPVRKIPRTLKRIASADELLEIVVKCFGISEAGLAGPGKEMRLSRIRQAMGNRAALRFLAVLQQQDRYDAAHQESQKKKPA